METPNFINQKHEKTPEDAVEKELTVSEQKEITTREKITLEIEGQAIEGEKYYFEYPERIQKETGILGYERVKIPKENIKVSLKNVLSELSDGEYPDKCLTHVMGGFAHDDHKPEMLEDFAKDKFFIQKIYDVETIERKRQKNHKLSNIFNYSPDTEYDLRENKRSTFSLYKKNDDGIREEVVKNEYIGDITNYKKELNSGEYFAATTQSGFNTIATGFWEGYSPSVAENSFTVGFPLFGSDNLYNEYLEKALGEYSRIKERDNPDRRPPGQPYMETLSNLIALYFLSKNKKNIKLSEKEHLSEDDLLEDGSAGPEFVQIMNDFVKKNPGGIAINDSDDFNKMWGTEFPGKNGQMLYPARAEYLVPIFIGHNEIPQLSWGHAKYAHYINDKSFNFFKFKHADHLPVKEEMASSGS